MGQIRDRSSIATLSNPACQKPMVICLHGSSTSLHCYCQPMLERGVQAATANYSPTPEGPPQSTHLIMLDATSSKTSTVWHFFLRKQNKRYLGEAAIQPNSPPSKVKCFLKMSADINACSSWSSKDSCIYGGVEQVRSFFAAPSFGSGSASSPGTGGRIAGVATLLVPKVGGLDRSSTCAP